MFFIERTEQGRRKDLSKMGINDEERDSTGVSRLGRSTFANRSQKHSR